MASSTAAGVLRTTRSACHAPLHCLIYIAVCTFPILVCSSPVDKEPRENRDRIEMPAAAAAPLPPRALRQLQPSQHFKELHRLRQVRARNSASSRLPAFRYNLSVKHNVTGPGVPRGVPARRYGEAATGVPAPLPHGMH
jgi:hypothetical protein